MNIIQVIDATERFISFNPSFPITIIGIVLLVFGLPSVFSREAIGQIIGGVLIMASLCVFIIGQTEYYEVPQTNYMIVCDEDTTVKEVMEKYKIIEQVGGALIVTDKAEG